MNMLTIGIVLAVLGVAMIATPFIATKRRLRAADRREAATIFQARQWASHQPAGNSR